MGPFFFCCVWMKMRAPVRQIACDLDAEGAPQGRESTLVDSSQSLRDRSRPSMASTTLVHPARRAPKDKRPLYGAFFFVSPVIVSAAKQSPDYLQYSGDCRVGLQPPRNDEPARRFDPLHRDHPQDVDLPGEVPLGVYSQKNPRRRYSSVQTPPPRQ